MPAARRSGVLGTRRQRETAADNERENSKP
jgi:hypothetical protein